MKRGDRVLLSFLAANHDPEQFENPGEVDLERNPNPHLAFGAGVHKCVGIHFARVEILVGLQEVFRRLSDYKLDRDNIKSFPNAGFVRGHLSLPATFTPGRRLQDDRLP